jgi:hypothetical protein
MWPARGGQILGCARRIVAAVHPGARLTDRNALAASQEAEAPGGAGGLDRRAALAAQLDTARSGCATGCPCRSELAFRSAGSYFSAFL